MKTCKESRQYTLKEAGESFYIYFLNTKLSVLREEILKYLRRSEVKQIFPSFRTFYLQKSVCPWWL